MKLSGRTDVQAPVEFVFDAISDFDFWERAALRRGAEVTRTDKLRQPAPGMSWMIRFGWRGRRAVRVLYAGSTLLLLAAGLLVGLGTAWGSGCTSGHGVCGIGRFSPRSLAATLVFMLFGVLAASLLF